MVVCSKRKNSKDYMGALTAKNGPALKTRRLRVKVATLKTPKNQTNRKQVDERKEVRPGHRRRFRYWPPCGHRPNERRLRCCTGRQTTGHVGSYGAGGPFRIEMPRRADRRRRPAKCGSPVQAHP